MTCSEFLHPVPVIRICMGENHDRASYKKRQLALLQVKRREFARLIMLLCQVELRSLEDAENEPTYYIVGRYRFDPQLQVDEDTWINWQIANQNFEIPATVTDRRKEIYVDGKSVVLSMNESEKEKFLAIYPDGIEKLMAGASLFLLRIFVEAKDKEALYQIRAAIAKGEKLLDGQKQLPNAG